MISGPRDLFLSLPQPRLLVIDGRPTGKYERDDFRTVQIRLAVTGALSVDLHNAVGEGRVVPAGTVTFCSSGLLQQLPILAPLTQARRRDEEQRGPRGESESLEEPKRTFWGIASTKCLPLLAVWPSERLGL